MICHNYMGHSEFNKNLGIALEYNPAVKWYFIHKCPESKPFVEMLTSDVPKNLSQEDVCKAEVFVIGETETSIVYVYPEKMNSNCDYIYNWDKKYLFKFADFTDKVVDTLIEIFYKDWKKGFII